MLPFYAPSKFSQGRFLRLNFLHATNYGSRAFETAVIQLREHSRKYRLFRLFPHNAALQARIVFQLQAGINSTLAKHFERAEVMQDAIDRCFENAKLRELTCERNRAR